MKGPVLNIELEEVEAAMKHMKSERASGPNGAIIKTLKAGIKRCLKLLT